MRFYRPQSRLAGFYASRNQDDPDTGFLEGGEIWAPKDWDIQWHTNQGLELYYQPVGTSYWEIGKKTYRLSAHGYYLIKRGVRHRLSRFTGRTPHFFYCVFDGHYLSNERQQALASLEKASFGSQGHALQLPFQGLMRELTMNSSYKWEIVESYLSVLCSEVGRLLEGMGEQKSRLYHPAAQRARELIEQNLGHVWKLEELAAICGISIPHLIDVFKKEYGQTPKQYLITKRLEEAWRRLSMSDQSITDIALELGFSSSQHFSANFYRYYTRTPSQVRRKKGSSA
ncbi:MAG: AraC family transcriptional regulator [Verrucomicrobiota bacterium]